MGAAEDESNIHRRRGLSEACFPASPPLPTVRYSTVSSVPQPNSNSTVSGLLQIPVHAPPDGSPAGIPCGLWLGDLGHAELVVEFGTKKHRRREPAHTPEGKLQLVAGRGPREGMWEASCEPGYKHLHPLWCLPRYEITILAIRILEGPCDVVFPRSGRESEHSQTNPSISKRIRVCPDESEYVQMGGICSNFQLAKWCASAFKIGIGPIGSPPQMPHVTSPPSPN